MNYNSYFVSRNTVICDCGNDIWEIDRTNGYAECGNCLKKRNFVERKAKIDQITPSQLASVERIKKYLEEHIYTDDKVEIKTKLTDYGDLICSATVNKSNPYLEKNIQAFIGRRGKIKMGYAHCGFRDNSKHVQNMLRK